MDLASAKSQRYSYKDRDQHFFALLRKKNQGLHALSAIRCVVSNLVFENQLHHTENTSQPNAPLCRRNSEADMISMENNVALLFYPHTIPALFHHIGILRL